MSDILGLGITGICAAAIVAIAWLNGRNASEVRKELRISRNQWRASFMANYRVNHARCSDVRFAFGLDWCRGECFDHAQSEQDAHNVRTEAVQDEWRHP